MASPDPPPSSSSSSSWDPSVSLETVRATVDSFAAERGWHKFHTPRNLMLALVGEIGELAEIFQWKGDDGAAPNLPAFTDEERKHVGEELSDVLVYTIRLADRCGVRLDEAVMAKLKRNAEKYPAKLCYGSSAKYTAYQNRGQDEGETATS
ncbi:dCTP pyrophosphatase 1 [Pseudoscourfieldia marina]|mmetsp:Transcript_4915/g.11147  ORF Transcript_4915/g.11147 Transcript_4915/m.11147 type:complete len:151 (-) Transcript_4915:844-1296(-)